MTMTLSALRSELAAVSAHDLAETNVAGIEATPHGVIFDSTDRDEFALDSLREDLAASEAALKQAEDEATELQAKLDALTGEQMDAADVAEEIERFKATARGFAELLADAEKELSALRKRKGTFAGYYLYASEVMAYLYDAQQDPKAAALVAKLHSFR